MKKRMNRLASLALALSLCLGLMTGTAAAIPSMEELEQAVTPIELAATADELSSGNYRVKYVADLTMSEGFAQAVVALNTGDYLKKLQFTCILEDELVEQISVADVKFTFSGAGAVNFVPDGEDYVTKGDNGELMIRYKLNADVVDEWRYMRASEIEAALMQEMTMTSAEKVVTAAELKSAMDGKGAITTQARVEITYAEGNIPVYDEPYILAAESGTVAMTIDGYSSSTERTYSVKVENPAEKGRADTNVSSAKKGRTITITASPEDGYRLTGLTVTAANGSAVAVRRVNATSFTFVMPAANVTVVPAFGLSAARPEDSGVSGKLNADDHIAFMVGDDQGTFRPDANITRAEVAQIFYALLKDKDVAITVQFDDVPEDAWYAKAVNTLASLGAVKGVGDGRFEPERNITRAEFATIASNFAKEARNFFDFDDVSKSHWAYPYISATAAYGWVAGVGDNNFEPDRNIQRAEAATIVNNMLGRIGDKDKIDAGEGRQFPDVDDSHWGWYEIGEATYGHDHDFNDTYTQEYWYGK